MTESLDAVVLALLWTTVVLRLPTLHRGPLPRTAWLVLLCGALSETVRFGAAGIGALTDAGLAVVVPLTGAESAAIVAPAGTGSVGVVPAAGAGMMLLAHLLGILCAVFLLRLISLITNLDASRPGSAARQWAAAAVTGLVLCGLFALSPDGVGAGAGYRPDAPPIPGPAVAYWLVLEGYLGSLLAVAMVVLWRVSRGTRPGLVRLGLHLVTAGALLHLSYTAYRIAYVLIHAAGAGASWQAVVPAFDVVRMIAILLIVAGSAVPRLAAVGATMRAYRSLYPLWRTIQQTFPAVILLAPPRTPFDLVAVDDLQLRLYRRVIEIRDGMLELRSRLPAGAIEEAYRFLEAHSPGARDRSALAEVCGIRLALHRLRTGAPLTGGEGQWVYLGPTMADEARWLCRVSRAYRRHGAPAGFVEWWTHRHADDPALAP